MNPIYLNAAVLPLFATWFIPEAIRNRKTGEYLGFRNRTVAMHFILILCMESFFLIEKYGLNLDAGFRVLSISAMPFLGALVFVKYTQKELYGNEIKFTKWW
ncbi:MAG: hypothetical protein O2971_19695 [Proteobacteria bacterium]|nr:hypothetical protein [Pseudomonadota bacterium]